MATRTLHTNFVADGLDGATVLGFREQQALGRPAEAVVSIQVGSEVDPEQVLGRGAVLSFASGSGPVHAFAGIIMSVTVVGSGAVGGSSMHRLEVHITSQMALLAHSFGSEIHQQLDVQQIVEKVLIAHGIDGSKQKWQLTGTYPKREYCVQYQESALAFVSRLLEEEGIYFRSKYVEGQGEVIVFEDDSTLCEPIDGDATLPFRPRAGLERDEDAIFSISEHHRMVSGKFVLRDYDFKRPKLDLTALAEADTDTDLERYDYPGLYIEPAEGERLARIRLEAEQVRREELSIEADCVRANAGLALTIADALADEINGEYLITSVVHELRPGDGGARPVYLTKATLLPKTTKFRTAQTTRAPILAGPQTAAVVAPEGAQAEEIHTDEHGRIKVKFHWDTSPEMADKASCWMRVSQLQTSGSMVLPRVGWEVVVEFLEGNPDRPLVTGKLDNGLFMPPYALPEGKTRTALATSSTPGGGGRNEIRFEDKAGAEEIMMKAQYNQSLATANNKTKNVGNCETRSVGVNETVTIGGDEEVKVTKGYQNTIGGDQSCTVGGNRSVEVNAVSAVTAGGSSTTSVGGNHFEMDGNPLQALLALAVQTAVQAATAAAARQLDRIQGAVQSRVDQAMGPINALASQAEGLGGGMRAVANGNLGAAAPLLASAAGLPSPGGFASALAGGGGNDGGGNDGGGASRGFDLGGPAALHEAGGLGTSAGAIAARNVLDQAVNGAIQRGIGAAGNALGEALGLDGGGGGGESAANEAGPEGSVAGVDAEDRAKGPGHSLNKVTGSHSETIGSLKITAALTGIMTNVAGSLNQDVGAARIEMVLGNRAESVESVKTENSLGLVILAKGDESESVGAMKTAMVGGAVLEKIGGGHHITAGGPATFIGAFHKIDASSSITFKCGGSEMVIDGGGVTIKAPLVTIAAGKIALPKVVSEV